MKKNWILATLAASSLVVNHTAVLAAEDEEESLDNKYAFNTIEVNENTATANEVTVSHDGEYSYTVNGNSAPLNHNEQEIAGYRDALAQVHTGYADMDLRESDILKVFPVALTSGKLL